MRGPARFINRPCVLVYRSESGAVDDYGNAVLDEQRVASLCELQLRRADEPGLAGETSSGLWDGYFLAGTDLRSLDAIEVAELGTFELVGDAPSLRNPRTRAGSHVEAALRKTGGPGRPQEGS